MKNVLLPRENHIFFFIPFCSVFKKLIPHRDLGENAKRISQHEKKIWKWRKNVRGNEILMRNKWNVKNWSNYGKLFRGDLVNGMFTIIFRLAAWYVVWNPRYRITVVLTIIITVGQEKLAALYLHTHTYSQRCADAMVPYGGYAFGRQRWISLQVRDPTFFNRL